MNRWLKRFITIVAVAVFCLGMAVTAFAAEDPSVLSESERIALAEALYGVEVQKDQLGLADTDFNNLRLGGPVQTYLCRNNMFESGWVMYPIIDNEKLILWAIENDGKFQLTAALVDEVNNEINNEMPFAIVYDKESVYLYAKDTFTLLAISAVEDDSRSVLDIDLAEDCVLKTVALSENTDFEYSSSVGRMPIYYGCDVKFVTQNPPSTTCWAATIACIANYKNGTSLSAISVVQGYYGTSNYNREFYDGEVPNVLSGYGLSYVYRNEAPSNNVILENIITGYPLYSSWVASGVRHAVCLYGINSAGGYVYIMDPEYGFTSAIDSGGTYTYVSGYSGTTLTLDRAVCHSW